MTTPEQSINNIFVKYDDQPAVQKDLYYSIEAIQHQAIKGGSPYTDLKAILAAKYADQLTVLADLKAVCLIAVDVMEQELAAYRRQSNA